MDGREFLAVAGAASRQTTEAYWRTAANRAHYALMLELLAAFGRWGLSLPGQRSVHEAVKKRVFVSTDPDMKQIGQWYDRLRALRQSADYDMGPVPAFHNNASAARAVQLATDAIALLDAVVGDAIRSAAIAAEIRAVFP
jgi:hypothetical protein